MFYLFIVVYIDVLGEVLRPIGNSGQKDVDSAVKVAREAFNEWRQVPAFERGQVLVRAASIIRVSVLTI